MRADARRGRQHRAARCSCTGTHRGPSDCHSVGHADTRACDGCEGGRAARCVCCGAVAGALRVPGVCADLCRVELLGRGGSRVWWGHGGAGCSLCRPRLLAAGCENGDAQRLTHTHTHTALSVVLPPAPPTALRFFHFLLECFFLFLSSVSPLRCVASHFSFFRPPCLLFCVRRCLIVIVGERERESSVSRFSVLVCPGTCLQTQTRRHTFWLLVMASAVLPPFSLTLRSVNPFSPPLPLCVLSSPTHTHTNTHTHTFHSSTSLTWS